MAVMSVSIIDGQTADISANEQAFSAGLLYESDGLFAFGFPASGDDDPSALPGKSDGSGAPDTSGSTGDQYDFIAGALPLPAVAAGARPTLLG
jgi:hypothetical protein